MRLQKRRRHERKGRRKKGKREEKRRGKQRKGQRRERRRKGDSEEEGIGEFERKGNEKKEMKK